MVEIPDSTLRIYCIKCYDAVNKGEPMVQVLGGNSPRQIFTDAHELLRKYICVSALYFRLTIMSIRKLAQDYAAKLYHNIPISWTEHRWTRSFF